MQINHTLEPMSLVINVTGVLEQVASFPAAWSI